MHDYPINKLQRKSEISKGRFLKSLGFKNLNKAFKKLEDFPSCLANDSWLISLLVNEYPDLKLNI